MPWSNGPITLYHGTDDLSAHSIRTSGIQASKFRSKTDFGKGFYVTTVLHQAEQWANQRCRRSKASSAAVLEYAVARDAIEPLRHLSFTLDDFDYYDFVDYCRGGGSDHGPSPRKSPYEVVYGPVSLWPQRLVIAACDQILFSAPGRLRDFDKPTQTLLPSSGRRFF